MEKNIINTNLITEYMKTHNKKTTKFCKLCRISPCTLKTIMSGKENFRIIALFKIARVINIKICNLFVK